MKTQIIKWLVWYDVWCFQQTNAFSYRLTIRRVRRARLGVPVQDGGKACTSTTFRDSLVELRPYGLLLRISANGELYCYMLAAARYFLDASVHFESLLHTSNILDCWTSACAIQMCNKTGLWAIETQTAMSLLWLQTQTAWDCNECVHGNWSAGYLRCFLIYLNILLFNDEIIDIVGLRKNLLYRVGWVWPPRPCREVSLVAYGQLQSSQRGNNCSSCCNASWGPT